MIIPNKSEFRDDFWIYVDDKKVCKWFSTISGVRVWEPRLSNLEDLYPKDCTKIKTNIF